MRIQLKMGHIVLYECFLEVLKNIRMRHLGLKNIGKFVPRQWVQFPMQLLTLISEHVTICWDVRQIVV